MVPTSGREFSGEVLLAYILHVPSGSKAANIYKTTRDGRMASIILIGDGLRSVWLECAPLDPDLDLRLQV